MEWSGRAPAPPGSEAGKGRQRRPTPISKTADRSDFEGGQHYARRARERREIALRVCRMDDA